MKVILTVLFLSLIANPALAGQTVAGENVNNIIRPLSIQMNKQQEEPDKKGTDVTNIYTIEVSALAGAESNKEYLIVYYLDGRFEEDFSATLPYSFKRNFKGHVAGQHEIKIDIEDGQNNILATQTMIINVVK